MGPFVDIGWVRSVKLVSRSLSAPRWMSSRFFALAETKKFQSLPSAKIDDLRSATDIIILYRIELNDASANLIGLGRRRNQFNPGIAAWSFGSPDPPAPAQTACQRKPTEPLGLSSSERCDPGTLRALPTAAPSKPTEARPRFSSNRKEIDNHPVRRYCSGQKKKEG